MTWKNTPYNPAGSWKIDPETPVFTFEGPFFIDLLTMLGNYLKMMTSSHQAIQKKLFRIFVELTQNVSNYSEEYLQINQDNKKVGIGELRIAEDQNFFLLTTKNLVRARDANVLSQRCEIINQTPADQLKDLKRELRKSSAGYMLGARIGLVQARLISMNPLDYIIFEKNMDYSYFKLTVKFDKDGEY